MEACGIKDDRPGIHLTSDRQVISVNIQRVIPLTAKVTVFDNYISKGAGKMRSVSSSGNKSSRARLLHDSATRKTEASFGAEETKAHTRATINCNVLKRNIRASLINIEGVRTVDVVPDENLFPIPELIEIRRGKTLRPDHSYNSRIINLGAAFHPSQALTVIGINGPEHCVFVRRVTIRYTNARLTIQFFSRNPSRCQRYVPVNSNIPNK